MKTKVESLERQLKELKGSQMNSSYVEKITKEFQYKIESLERSEQAKMAENVSLKDIIDRVRIENDK